MHSVFICNVVFFLVNPERSVFRTDGARKKRYEYVCSLEDGLEGLRV